MDYQSRHFAAREISAGIGLSPRRVSADEFGDRCLPLGVIPLGFAVDLFIYTAVYIVIIYSGWSLLRRGRNVPPAPIDS